MTINLPSRCHTSKPTRVATSVNAYHIGGTPTTGVSLPTTGLGEGATTTNIGDCIYVH